MTCRNSFVIFPGLNKNVFGPNRKAERVNTVPPTLGSNEPTRVCLLLEAAASNDDDKNVEVDLIPFCSLLA